jgi:hypothetical protein
MPTKNYTRKTDGNGAFVNPIDGSPGFIAEISAALPGRTWRCRADGTNVDIIVDGAVLTGTEDTALDTAHANWVAVTPSRLKLDSYLPEGDKGRDHRVIDYKSGLITRLYKKLSVVFRGEVRQVQYFADNTETDLVLQVDIVYNRTGNGLAVDRTTTRTWYKEDGSTHSATKTTVKEYDTLHQMIEGRRRRTNVINMLTIDVLNMLVVTSAVDPLNPTAQEIVDAEALGSTFMESYSGNIQTYIGTGDLSWVGTPGVGNDSTSWLDNTFDGSPTVIAIAAASGWTTDIRSELQEALVDIGA